MWVVNAVGRGMCVQRIDTLRAHSSPVVCPVCCDASKYSCSSCIAVKKKAAAKAARCDRRKRSLATENACSSLRMRQPMALLKAPNFKLKSKSKVCALTLKNRAKAFPSAVIESCFHSPADDAQCQVCQSPYDEDKMLLCDKCNAGWHLDCLNPPLATVPSGRWECPICTCIQSCPMKAHLRRREPSVMLAKWLMGPAQYSSTWHHNKAANRVKLVSNIFGSWSHHDALEVSITTGSHLLQQNEYEYNSAYLMKSVHYRFNTLVTTKKHMERCERWSQSPFRLWLCSDEFRHWVYDSIHSCLD